MRECHPARRATSVSLGRDHDAKTKRSSGPGDAGSDTPVFGEHSPVRGWSVSLLGVRARVMLIPVRVNPTTSLVPGKTSERVLWDRVSIYVRAATLQAGFFNFQRKGHTTGGELEARDGHPSRCYVDPAKMHRAVK